MGQWEFKTLSDLCDFEKGKTGLAKATAGDYPLVATGAYRKSCDSYQFDTKAVCVPLVSSTGHGHRSLNYVHYQEGKFALGTILVAITPKDEQLLNPQFLHLYLSELKNILLVPLMRGAANVSLSITNIKTVKIPLPSIQEQNGIVDQFNSLENDHSSLVNEIIHQQELLQELRQSILQDAVQGKLTQQWRKDNPDVEPASAPLKRIKEAKEKLIKEKKIRRIKTLPVDKDDEPFSLPKKWVWCRLEDMVLASIDCPHATAKYTDSGVLCVRTSNIKIGYLDFSEEKFVSEDTFLKRTPKITPQAHDILYSREGGRLGIAGIVPDRVKLCMGQRMILFRTSNSVVSHTLTNTLNSAYIFNNALALSGGSASPHLNVGDIRNFLIPLPPAIEQKVITSKIKELFSHCDQLEEQINQSKSNSELLMQTVLKEAFTS